MNHVSLVGNLGQDPEMKYFDSGSKVTKFSLALRGHNKKEDNDGNKRSRTFVLVSRVEFLKSKKQSEQTEGLPAEVEQESQEPEQQQFVNPDDYFISEDQIPF